MNILQNENILLLELIIIVFIIIYQFYLFRRNKIEIKTLASIYPSKAALSLSRLYEKEHNNIEDEDIISLNNITYLIQNESNFNLIFKKIIEDTNSYLKKNKGYATDFELIQDIAASKTLSLEQRIDTNVAQPLYFGLLGTFSGVIIGLLKIAFAGVTDATIQTFIGGVLIGMIASACGLWLTVIGNKKFRDAKELRDNLQTDYLTFLRVNLLPSLYSNSQSTLHLLKDNLDRFNQEFTKNMEGFEGSISGLGAYSADLRSLILELRKTQFAKIANSNLKVFNKITESRAIFERFMQYQIILNETLQHSRETFTGITSILNRVNTFESNIDKVGKSLDSYTDLFSKTLKSLNTYILKAEQDADQTGRLFDSLDKSFSTFVEKRMESIEKDTEIAAKRFDEYVKKLEKRLDDLHQDVFYKQMLGLVNSLNPNIDHLKKSVNGLSLKYKENTNYLVSKIQDNENSTRQITLEFTSFQQQNKEFINLLLEKLERSEQEKTILINEFISFQKTNQESVSFLASKLETSKKQTTEITNELSKFEENIASFRSIFQESSKQSILIQEKNKELIKILIKKIKENEEEKKIITNQNVNLLPKNILALEQAIVKLSDKIEEIQQTDKKAISGIVSQAKINQNETIKLNDNINSLQQNLNTLFSNIPKTTNTEFLNIPIFKLFLKIGIICFIAFLVSFIYGLVYVIWVLFS